MICPKCKKENIAEAKFCIKCGNGLKEKTIPTEQEKKPQEKLKYCVFCKERIQYDAIKCPLCKKYNDYAEVPWYRKNWFVILSFLLFIPASFFSLITGDIYYQRKGQIMTYGRGVTILLRGLAGAATFGIFLTISIAATNSLQMKQKIAHTEQTKAELQKACSIASGIFSENSEKTVTLGELAAKGFVPPADIELTIYDGKKASFVMGAKYRNDNKSFAVDRKDCSIIEVQ